MDQTSRELFDTTLTSAAGALGLEITPEALSKMREHFELVVETNRVMNLTRITDPQEAAVKHYADSLAVLRLVAERNIPVKTVLDIGTGAGFPAIPIAIARPECRVTAIDSTRKKADFVRKAASQLELSNVYAEHARAGEWKTESPFCLVVLRAVSKLGEALDQSAGYVSESGYIVAYKSAELENSEEVAARKSAKHHRLIVEPAIQYELALKGERITRVLHVFASKASSLRRKLLK